ncbi:MAG: hypothetical protein ACETWE_02550 [Candidatus Bathyarchaeia archaeon]
MTPEGSSRIAELSKKFDSTMERLESLSVLVDSSPEYAEFAPYLRIAIASLHTAVGMYGEPLKIAASARSTDRISNIQSPESTLEK